MTKRSWAGATWEGAGHGDRLDKPWKLSTGQAKSRPSTAPPVLCGDSSPAC